MDRWCSSKNQFLVQQSSGFWQAQGQKIGLTPALTGTSTTHHHHYRYTWLYCSPSICKFIWRRTKHCKYRALQIVVYYHQTFSLVFHNFHWSCNIPLQYTVASKGLLFNVDRHAILTQISAWTHLGEFLASKNIYAPQRSSKYYAVVSQFPNHPQFFYARLE